MIELKDFIRQTLTEVILGVGEVANTPEGREVIEPSQKNDVEKINFEISVTTENSSELTKEGKAKIYVLSGGIDSSNTEKNMISQKISFSVPFKAGMTYFYQGNKEV